MTNRSKFILRALTVIIILILSYKVYAPYTIDSFNASNLKNINRLKNEIKKDEMSFAVVGNIKNSITTFDKNILKKIKNDETDFIISTGNNVIDGDEGKYRVFYRTLEKNSIPFITGVGDDEINDEGYRNYYKYFGPFYYSFALNNAYFIFLDTTGYTNKNWIKDWVKGELKRSLDYQYRFVIMNSPPIEIDVDYIINDDKKYISDLDSRKYYQEIFSKYNVTAVFSSNLEMFKKINRDGVPYFISGGSGGALILDNPDSFYHYLKVKTQGDKVDYKVIKIKSDLESINSKIAKTLESIWIVLQSFLYTNYLTILLVGIISILIWFIIYLELNKEVNYYRDFNKNKKELKKEKLKIAMFTNNYFPFIGGVPISIKRLAKGLRKKGHTVYIFAPEYSEKTSDEEYIIRCKAIYNYKKEGFDIPITNIFSKKISNKFKELNIDVVHVHHPFWLGSKGRNLAKEENIPVVLTYHTRLEKYAHYVPDIFILRDLFRNRISHFLIKRFSNRCDAVFAPTNTAKEYLRNIGVSKYIEVLSTGVDMDSYDINKDKIEDLSQKYINKDEIILFSVSRLSKEKNLYFLLRAIKKIKNISNINFKCLIAGDGSEREKLEEFTKKEGIDDKVIFLGNIDNKKISSFYILSDIFVFTSKSETQGMVLLEAMAGRTPVVAIRSSGIDDVIENGKNGYKTSDDLEDWAKKVMNLMENKNQLEKMSKYAYDVAKKNSIDNMATKANKVYNKILNIKNK